MPAKPSSKSKKFQPSREQIAVRAYRLWEERGKQSEGAEENWLDAERELRAMLPSNYQAQDIDYSELGIQPDPRI